jgi:hypothetical protein
MDELVMCPRCRREVSVYVPDCPSCGYFIWGDDIDEESLVSGVSGGDSFFGDDDMDDYWDDYNDYDDADWAEEDNDWDEDDLEGFHREKDDW